MADNYKLKYNFGTSQIKVETRLKQIYENSLKYYRQNYRYLEKTEYEYEIKIIKIVIQIYEEYLYYFYKNYNVYFSDILKAMDKLAIFTVLSENERGIYGKFKDSIIYINPNLKANSNLGKIERIVLYTAHELNHLVHDVWMKFIENELNTLVRNRQIKLESAQRYYDGFSFLDECLAQEKAENFTYYLLKKKRPAKTLKSQKIFSKTAFLTNFDFYGEMQKPGILFGKTLRGLGCIENEDEVLKKLSIRALSPDFSKKIIDEYIHDSQLNDLFILLEYLGVLKEASYAQFGMGDIKALQISKKVYDNFKILASSLQDTRMQLPTKSLRG